MRAPISDTARRILADRQATRDLKKLLSSGQDRGRITYWDKVANKELVVEVSKVKSVLEE
jgi:hypothetical protein